MTARFGWRTIFLFERALWWLGRGERETADDLGVATFSWESWPMELSDHTDPTLARVVVTALVTAVVLCLVVLLLLTALGDHVVHN